MTIWAVSDGRAGIENQALGLAEAVARVRPAAIEVKRVAWKGAWGRLPWRLNPFPRLALQPQAGIAPPWPDLWIAAGRATLPLSLRLKRWSQGETFVVQLQDPRTPLGAYDLVVPPTHDQLDGANVLSITGAPNRITRARLDADLARWRDGLDPLPRPRAAVMIGGRSRTHDLTPERAAWLAGEIEAAVTAAGGSVMVSFSRRTPAEARKVLSERLARLPGVIWDDQGDNPYFAFLAAADMVLVTEDSANLATDAASAGAPVLILVLEGGSAKFARFHAELAALGVSRPFAGRLETWTYPPFRETDRAAQEVLRRLDERTRP